MAAVGVAKSGASASAKGAKGKSSEEVFAGFQALRAEQRQLANKISEIEMDLNEHKIVVETLSGVESSRRCFRMVGGVLVERCVGSVLPELQANRERLPRALAALGDQLQRKGEQINAYIEQHDIRVQRADAAPPAPAPAADDAKPTVLVPSA